jgi:glycosyltransferase involved in cell wall biosynthesis
MLPVLHTYSNWKWTGPADHALNLAAWLDRSGEARVLFACGRNRGASDPIRLKAEARGLVPIDGFRLDKHLNWRILPDVRTLKRLMARERIALVHTHQENDSLTAVLAGLGGRLVRTLYDGDLPPLTRRRRFILQRTACIFTASAAARAGLAERFPAKPIEKLDIPVDLDRFRPLPKNRALLDELGLRPDAVVAGIVARVQRHRKFEVLLEALKTVVAEAPGFKFLIIGRGTHIETVAREPVRRCGLEGSVRFTGYRGDDYVDILNLLDYKVFLHPGSDGACRAVREALSCGKPIIASRMGILPELVRDGETGMLVDTDPASLAAAMLAYYRREDLRRQGARAARRYAERVLDPRLAVARVLDGYRRLASKAPK